MGAGVTAVAAAEAEKRRKGTAAPPWVAGSQAETHDAFRVDADLPRALAALDEGRKGCAGFDWQESPGDDGSIGWIGRRAKGVDRVELRVSLSEAEGRAVLRIDGASYALLPPAGRRPLVMMLSLWALALSRLLWPGAMFGTGASHWGPAAVAAVVAIVGFTWILTSSSRYRANAKWRDAMRLEAQRGLLARFDEALGAAHGQAFREAAADGVRVRIAPEADQEHGLDEPPDDEAASVKRSRV